MKFAINYSPQAAQLISEKRIAVDLYKCPAWPDLVAEARQSQPVYIHFPLISGRGHNRLSFDDISTWLEQTGTFYVNTHIGPLGADYGIPTGTRKALHVEAMTARVMADIGKLVEHFGAERVIAENAPMPDLPKYDIPVVPVENIRQIIEETGCGLLLDLAHAALTCHRLGLDVYAYVSALPVHNLRELHITGIMETQPGQLEDHYPMTEADWPLVEWAFEQIWAGRWRKPDIVAFEYGGLGQMFEFRSDIAVIAQQVPRLYRLAHPEKATDGLHAGS